MAQYVPGGCVNKHGIQLSQASHDALAPLTASTLLHACSSAGPP